MDAGGQGSRGETLGPRGRAAQVPASGEAWLPGAPADPAWLAAPSFPRLLVVQSTVNIISSNCKSSFIEPLEGNWERC